MKRGGGGPHLGVSIHLRELSARVMGFWPFSFSATQRRVGGRRKRRRVTGAMRSIFKIGATRTVSTNTQKKSMTGRVGRQFEFRAVVPSNRVNPDQSSQVSPGRCLGCRGVAPEIPPTGRMGVLGVSILGTTQNTFVRSVTNGQTARTRGNMELGHPRHPHPAGCPSLKAQKAAIPAMILHRSRRHTSLNRETHPFCSGSSAR